MTRVLANKTLKKWREQAVKDLLGDIERAWPTAKKHLEKPGDQDRTVVVRTSRLGALELQRVCDALWNKDRAFAPATRKTSHGDQIDMEIAATSLKLVRETLRGKP